MATVKNSEELSKHLQDICKSVHSFVDNSVDISVWISIWNSGHRSVDITLWNTKTIMSNKLQRYDFTRKE